MVRMNLRQYMTLMRIADGKAVPPNDKQYQSLLRRQLISRDCKLTEKGKAVLDSIGGKNGY